MSGLNQIKSTMRKEKEAIELMIEQLDPQLDLVVDLIEACTGKVIFIGIGKSGHIGKKLAATFASTGTPSFFLHAAEAVHGDLGMITEQDVCILLSNSGNTAEVCQNIEWIERIGAKSVAFTSNAESILAKKCDFLIYYPPIEEADPLGLAPTSSSTMALVMGDALASALMMRRSFTAKDFYRYHPGGALGSKLRCENE